MLYFFEDMIIIIVFLVIFILKIFNLVLIINF